MRELLGKRLYELYAAYAERRTDEALREFNDSVVMTNYAPVDIFPISGRKQGKAAIAATMKTAHAEFDYPAHQPVLW